MKLLFVYGTALISIVLFWIGLVQIFIYDNDPLFGVLILTSGPGLIILTSYIMKYCFNVSYIRTIQKIPFLESKHILYIATSIVSLIIYGVSFYDDYNHSTTLSKITNMPGVVNQKEFIASNIEDANKAIVNSVGFFIISSFLSILLIVQIKKVITDEIEPDTD